MITFDGKEVNVPILVPPKRYRSGPFIKFKSGERVLRSIWRGRNGFLLRMVVVKYLDKRKVGCQVQPMPLSRAEARFKEAAQRWVNQRCQQVKSSQVWRQT
jgi:hypothetical protein